MSIAAAVALLFAAYAILCLLVSKQLHEAAVEPKEVIMIGGGHHPDSATVGGKPISMRFGNSPADVEFV
jgi:hypothetical protein